MDLSKQLDLRKQIVLDLKKEKGLNGQQAQVILALDFSGSMNTLYQNGSVQTLVERVLPLGLAFDDNGEVDFYLFQNNSRKLPENITLANVAGYINKKVIGKYSMGGTEYAPVINDIVKQFVETKTTTKEVSSGGFLGFGKKTSTVTEQVAVKSKFELPVYVIFITDGENSDKDAARQAIINAAEHGIFFQFIGIGNQTFTFLKELDTLTGRNIDNANFFQVANLQSKTDEDLYQLLLNEFPSFITEARTKNLIK